MHDGEARGLVSARGGERIFKELFVFCRLEFLLKYLFFYSLTAFSPNHSFLFMLGEGKTH